MTDSPRTPTVTVRDYMAVSEARDKHAFQHRLVEFAARLDFGLVSALLVVDNPGQTPSLHAVGNVPKAFLASADDPVAAKRDPVLRRLRQSPRPFTYDQSFYVGAGAGDLWEHQAAFGYKTGISVSLHSSAGRHFYLGVDRDEALPDDDASVTRLMADLQLLAVYAQETAGRLFAPDIPAGIPIRPLSQRELEVLRWTREGKSAWAVGQILHISEHTVNYFLRQAMRKLKTSSKLVAVHLAIRLGLLPDA
jgi:DNA-binding CsgD family transcriptional regulator